MLSSCLNSLPSYSGLLKNRAGIVVGGSCESLLLSGERLREVLLVGCFGVICG